MKDLVRTLEQQMAEESGTAPDAAPRRRLRRTKHGSEPASSSPRSGKTLKYHKVAFGLTGNKTRAYTVAVLRVLAVATVKKPAFSRKALSAFFACDSLIRYHIKRGNLETVEAGTVRLTDDGLEFFKERAKLKDDVRTFEQAIRKGEDCGFPLMEIEVQK